MARLRNRFNWQKAWMPITCRVGAVRYQRNKKIANGEKESREDKHQDWVANG
jgi:hypothetical protein